MMGPCWIRDCWQNGGLRGRIWLGAWALAILGLLVNVLIAAGERNDMDIFLQASADLRAGRNAYLLRYNEWYRYFYSPFFALAIAPLEWLGAAGAKWLWGLGIIALMLRSLWIMESWLGLSGAPPVERARFHALLLLLLFQPVRDNINSMQLTPLLVWISLEGLRLIRAERPWLGGALIAIGLDAKLLPAVLLPYLLWRRHWMGALASVTLFAALQFAPALALGWDELMELHRTRAELLNPTDARHILDEEEPSFIALGSLLSAYLSTEGGSSHTLALPRNLAALTVEQIAVLLLIGRLTLIALTLAFVGWPPFRNELNDQRVLREAGYLLLCTILLFPHQRNYSMLLAAPAIAWLLHARLMLPSGRVAKRWTIGLVLVFLGLNTELMLGEFADVYAHYKLKSFVAIGLIAMLVASPVRQGSRSTEQP